jgi:hypothetical protein
MAILLLISEYFQDIFHANFGFVLGFHNQSCFVSFFIGTNIGSRTDFDMDLSELYQYFIFLYLI